jgi:uncharacterized protein (DUF302 family)
MDAWLQLGHHPGPLYSGRETSEQRAAAEGFVSVPSIDIVQVSHVRVDFHGSFDEVTASLEKLLGRFDPTVSSTFAKDPSLADRQLQSMEGEEYLMIFQILDHGGLFKLIGQPRKAKRYTIGNPRIAFQMTRHDIRAGLYVPFNILVVEQANDTVRVEYDLPSSVLNQFGNAQVSEVARQLDGKVERLLAKASQIFHS